jgi:anti-anti-sigma regulatory factor
VLKVSGYLDTTTAGELETALYGLLERETYKVVVRNHGGDLKLAGMVGDVYEVFQLLEFHSILEAYPTLQEAVDAFKPRSGS